MSLSLVTKKSVFVVLLFALLFLGMAFALGQPMLILMLFGCVIGFMGVSWVYEKKNVGAFPFYVALQFSYVWVTTVTVFLPFISPLQKVDYAVVLTSIFASIIFVVKDFKFYWKSPAFRFMFSFFLVGLFYVMFYRTDFILSKAITGYYGSASKDTNTVPASYIV